MERTMLVLGVLFIGTYLLARLYSSIISKLEINEYKAAASGATKLPDTTASTSKDAESNTTPLLGTRIKKYERQLLRVPAPPIALLQIPRLQFETPVFDSIDRIALNAGTGRIPGTARPGEFGNIGIAGHRDGFFRVLKDVKLGDTLELLTANRSTIYVVDHIKVVEPTDINVLSPRPASSLTLVTCYPFHYIGRAPQRYIVQATLRAP